MRVAYTQDEFVGSTELAKNFGGFIDKIVSRGLEKIAVVRHNKAEAVILSIGEYERMREIADLVEDLEIAAMIAERDIGVMKEGLISFESYHERRKGKERKVV
jgi:PHD/YefM family antitoxin component YafN of YafNO toxin-antitoxin module